MNLENVWMFDGDAFYYPNQLMFLEPLMQHIGIDFEQFVAVLKKSASNQQRNSIVKINKQDML